MLLSIVIPFYNEGTSTIFPLLSTINAQKGIDFDKVEVILSNDGYEETKVKMEDFSLLANIYGNLCIILAKENKGSGVARQNGLDIATGKYVMFCDCDDLLHNVGILGALVQEMENTNCQMISTPWLEELVYEGGTTFINHQQEMTWLHGKMFNRAFLTSNNVRFHDTLRVHEDTYLLSIIGELAPDKRYLPETSYIWCFNNDSITRRNEGIYSFDSMDVFCIAVCESIKNLIDRGMSNVVEYKVIQLLAYIYFITQSAMWQVPEAEQYLNNMVNALSDNMAGLWKHWNNATIERINEIYNGEYVKATREFPKVDFITWVKSLDSYTEDK